METGPSTTNQPHISPRTTDMPPEPMPETQHAVAQTVYSEDQLLAPGQSAAALLDQLTRVSAQLQHYRAWISQVHARVQHINSKALSNAKRLYVGNLQPGVTEDELCSFLNVVMEQTGGQVGPLPAVLQCHLTAERSFAFAEFRSVEEASNAMALDGVSFSGLFLKIRRPSNYDLASSLMLGPVTPVPTMDLNAVNLMKPLPEDSPNKLFVGGLPCEWLEDAVRKLLTPFGTLKTFNLVMDKQTGNSKGYAFCEYEDDAATETVIVELNGKRAGSKTLTVKRAAEGVRVAPLSGASCLPQPCSIDSYMAAGMGFGLNSLGGGLPRQHSVAGGSAYGRPNSSASMMGGSDSLQGGQGRQSLLSYGMGSSGSIPSGMMGTVTGSPHVGGGMQYIPQQQMQQVPSDMAQMMMGGGAARPSLLSPGYHLVSQAPTAQPGMQAYMGGHPMQGGSLGTMTEAMTRGSMTGLPAGVFAPTMQSHMQMQNSWSGPISPPTRPGQGPRSMDAYGVMDGNQQRSMPGAGITNGLRG